MNHQPVDPQQRRIALLALAATKPANDRLACPGDAQLTAFIEHRLAGAARDAMVRHLNRCPTCYEVWLATLGALQDIPEPTPVRRTISDTPTTHWQRFRALMRWQPLLAIPATAVTVLAGILLLWPWAPSLTEQIEAQYAAIRRQPSTSLAVLVEELPLPWERSALGFSTGQQSPATRAFGAGLWVGRAALLGENADIALPEFLTPTTASPWPDSEWATYYQAGRWMVLLWTLTQSVQSTGDWSAQLELLKILRSQLGERGAEEPVAQWEIELLASLEPLLVSLARQENDAERARLSRRLEVLMQQLMFPPRSLSD